MSETDFLLRPMIPSDAASIAGLLQSQPAEYLRFFYAFGADEAAIAEILKSREKDVYSGLFWQGALICVFMLRGWDEGYDIPSFGLVVAADRRGREVLTVAMEAAKLISRLAGADRMMCKVHPGNVGATRGALRLGWIADCEEPETGNLIYYFDLRS
ncbi:MAG TPA: GNAT family N-acetyltransferase [Allosphingosinicella sp.]|nr:GNAT family N-acetyltransferase [Allosphingosinicella sp.]